jgi:hypothetical protein
VDSLLNALVPVVMVLAVLGIVASLVRDELHAHSTWFVSSRRLTGVELATCFKEVAARRFDAWEAGTSHVTVQPPGMDWLLTAKWHDRADATGIAHVYLEGVFLEPFPNGRWPLLRVIRNPAPIAARIRAFVARVRKLDPDADVGRKRAVFRDL